MMLMLKQIQLKSKLVQNVPGMHKVSTKLMS